MTDAGPRQDAETRLREIAEAAGGAKTFAEWEALVDSIPSQGGQIARALLVAPNPQDPRIKRSLGSAYDSFLALARTGKALATPEDLDRAKEETVTRGSLQSVVQKQDPYWHWTPRFVFDLQTNQVEIRVFAGLSPEDLTLDMLKSPDELVELAGWMCDWAFTACVLAQRHGWVMEGNLPLERTQDLLGRLEETIGSFRKLLSGAEASD